MKKIIVAGLAILGAATLAFGAYYLANAPKEAKDSAPIEETGTETPQDIDNDLPAEEAAIQENENGKMPETGETTNKSQDAGKTIIGKSVQGREIVAYHFGDGQKEILFVGGAHGGYSWNTALLAYQWIDYLKNNGDKIPANIKITVIPALNPDGLAKVVDAAGPFSANDVLASADTALSRFNANNVDLNRNFDCEWKTSGVWQSKTVSGGAAPFSEPESAAIRDYVQNNRPSAVVAWYTSAGGVFASSCNNGVSATTQAITDAYANASGYPAHKDFDFYEITGDMTNWLAKIGVPAIGVVLSTANDTELSKNQAGCRAVIEYFANKK